MLGVELLSPTCNITTILDGRGGIFTWVPPEPIVEFNLIYYSPGSARGLHYHPEFVEYILITHGSGAFVTRDGMAQEGDERIIHLSKGVCLRIPIAVLHTIYAIEPMSGLAMLTRKWDDCDVPAVRVGQLAGIPQCESQ
jgi:mannose-6-phosphate isomerase-like protein (cupin superfamily)